MENTEKYRMRGVNNHIWLTDKPNRNQNRIESESGE